MRRWRGLDKGQAGDKGGAEGGTGMGETQKGSEGQG